MPQTSPSGSIFIKRQISSGFLFCISPIHPLSGCRRERTRILYISIRVSPRPEMTMVQRRAEFSTRLRPLCSYVSRARGGGGTLNKEGVASSVAKRGRDTSFIRETPCISRDVATFCVASTYFLLKWMYFQNKN